MARSWGIQPGEFWDMTFVELFAEFEMVRPRDPETDYAGNLRRGDVEDLLAWEPDV